MCFGLHFSHYESLVNMTDSDAPEIVAGALQLQPVWDLRMNDGTDAAEPVAGWIRSGRVVWAARDIVTALERAFVAVDSISPGLPVDFVVGPHGRDSDAAAAADVITRYCTSAGS